MSITPPEMTPTADAASAASPAGPDDPRPAEATSLKSLRLRGLLATLTSTNLVLCIFWGAIQSIFLAIQVQNIDPNGSAGALALIVGIGAIGAMVAAPVVGALTDRTRTRWGGRVPWMLVGAAASLVLSVLFAFSTSIAELVVYWFLLQVATNFILTPVSVHIPERVPLVRRGLFSAAMGFAQTAGGVIGQSFGAMFSSIIPVGYIVVGVLLMLAVVLFAIVNRRSNLGESKPRLDVVAILKTFWVSPRRHPNFAWAFAGRFLLMVGYFPLSAYTLYILQSYVGLGKEAVALVPAVGLANLLGTLIGTPIAGILADRLKAVKPLIFAASIILVIAFAIPMASPTVPAMLAYGFLSGMGLGSYMSVDYVLITQVLPSAEDAGKDLGIINITTTLPQTIGVAVGGTIVTVFAGYFALFPVAIVLVIAGAVLLFLVRRVR